MLNSSAILELDQISKTFASGEEEVRVLREISFTLAAGDSCSIVGSSGSGKTTLLAIAAGLEPPSSGRVVLDNNNLDEMSEDEKADLRASSLGFVFQSFQLVPTLTALENVLVPLELRGGADEERAVELLSRVGLEHRLSHYPVQLSGGEQQRVAIARAFVHQPKILFADEPTGNLDRENGDLIANLLFELNEIQKTTLVLATHDSKLAERTNLRLEIAGGSLSQ